MNKNMGSKDRVARLLLTIILFIFALIQESWILAGIGFFTLFEAASGWCLFHKITGRNSCTKVLAMVFSLLALSAPLSAYYDAYYEPYYTDSYYDHGYGYDGYGYDGYGYDGYGYDGYGYDGYGYDSYYDPYYVDYSMGVDPYFGLSDGSYWMQPSWWDAGYGGYSGNISYISPLSQMDYNNYPISQYASTYGSYQPYWITLDTGAAVIAYRVN